jgi:hypothetical protein
MAAVNIKVAAGSDLMTIPDNFSSPLM